MANRADPDQLASETNWSGSTVSKGRVYPGSAGQGLTIPLGVLQIVGGKLHFSDWLIFLPYQNYHIRTSQNLNVHFNTLSCVWKTACGLAKSVDPDQMPHSIASYLGLILFAPCLSQYLKSYYGHLSQLRGIFPDLLHLGKRKENMCKPNTEPCRLIKLYQVCSKDWSACIGFVLHKKVIISHNHSAILTHLSLKDSGQLHFQPKEYLGRLYVPGSMQIPD